MANTKVTGDVIANGTISTVHIADDAITAAKLDSTATGITFADLTVSATTATLNLSGSNTGASLINFGDSDDGNVGRIYYDHTNNFMQFKTNDSEKLRIDSSGNVGIGEANPSQQLTLSNSSSSKIQIKGHSASNGLFIGMDSAVNAQLWNVENGYIRFATNDTERMRIESNGNLLLKGTGVTSLLKFDSSAFGQILSTSNILYYDIDTQVFRNSAGTSEHMRIGSSGNVGIGTSNPQTDLHIAQSVNNTPTIFRLENADSTIETSQEVNTIQFYSNDASTGGTGITSKISQIAENAGNEYGLALYTYNISDTLTERLRIDNSGNVGINQASPGAKLDVELAATNTYSGTALNIPNIIVSNTNSSNVNGQAAIISLRPTGWAGITSGVVNIGAVQPSNAKSAHFVVQTRNAGTYGERFRIASDGRIGFGVSPFAHSLGTSVNLDLLGNGGIWGYAGATYVNSNAYYDSGWKYKSTNPAAVLQVGGSSQTLTFRQAASGTADAAITFSQPFTIDANGNIGIGTTSPSAKLEVRGTAPTYTDASTVFWGGTTNNDSHNGIMLSSFGDALGGSLASNLLYSNSNTPTQTNTNRSSGQIKFGNTTTASKTSDINFGGYYKGTTAFVERMRINGDGNVGIGTTSPAKKLDVAGDFKLDGINGGHFENFAYGTQLNISEITTGGWARANRIVTSDSGGDVFYGVFGEYTTVNYAYWNIGDGSNNSTNYNNANGVFLTRGGKVGIATTTPAESLTCIGNIHLASVYNATGITDAYLYLQTRQSGNWRNAYVGQTGNNLVFGTGGTGTTHTNATERMRIDSDGSIHQNYISGLAGTSDYGFTIAKQSGYSQVYFRADTTSTRYIQRFYNDNSGTLQNVGNIIISGSTTSYATSSDYRLKENVVELTGALDRVSQLKPSRFNFIADADKTVDGFLAHEVQNIVPEAITGEKDGMRTEEYEITPAALDEEGNITEEAVMGTREVPEYQGIDQSKLVPLLVGAIQELKANNDSLRARIEILENQ